MSKRKPCKEERERRRKLQQGSMLQVRTGDDAVAAFTALLERMGAHPDRFIMLDSDMEGFRKD
jgi:hypothetical protein